MCNGENLISKKSALAWNNEFSQIRQVKSHVLYSTFYNFLKFLTKRVQFNFVPSTIISLT